MDYTTTIEAQQKKSCELDKRAQKWADVTRNSVGGRDLFVNRWSCWAPHSLPFWPTHSFSSAAAPQRCWVIRETDVITCSYGRFWFIFLIIFVNRVFTCCVLLYLLAPSTVKQYLVKEFQIENDRWKLKRQMGKQDKIFTESMRRRGCWHHNLSFNITFALNRVVETVRERIVDLKTRLIEAHAPSVSKYWPNGKRKWVDYAAFWFGCFRRRWNVPRCLWTLLNVIIL